MALSATVASPITSLSFVRSEDQCFKQQKNTCSRPVGVKPLSNQFHPFESKRNVIRAFRGKHSSPICATAFHPFERNVTRASRGKHSSLLICAAALNAKCSAEQTQTITRQSSTITIAPSQGKEKSPDLDDGGTGFPPRDDGDGGGGGGGGGGGWAGGFFFFGFLAFLGMFKEDEGEKESSR